MAHTVELASPPRFPRTCPLCGGDTGGLHRTVSFTQRPGLARSGAAVSFRLPVCGSCRRRHAVLRWLGLGAVILPWIAVLVGVIAWPELALLSGPRAPSVLLLGGALSLLGALAWAASVWWERALRVVLPWADPPVVAVRSRALAEELAELNGTRVSRGGYWLSAGRHL